MDENAGLYPAISIANLKNVNYYIFLKLNFVMFIKTLSRLH